VYLTSILGFIPVPNTVLWLGLNICIFFHDNMSSSLSTKTISPWLKWLISPYSHTTKRLGRNYTIFFPRVMDPKCLCVRHPCHTKTNRPPPRSVCLSDGITLSPVLILYDSTGGGSIEYTWIHQSPWFKHRSGVGVTITTLRSQTLSVGRINDHMFTSSGIIGRGQRVNWWGSYG
jgi:hypothetical protein